MLAIRLLMASTLSLGFTHAAAITVTVCAQNSYVNQTLSCESNSTGAALTKSTNASSTNGSSPFVNTSQASASARAASFGEFGAAASTHWNNQTNFVSSNSASGNVRVDDRLFISALTSGIISLTFDITGTASTAYTSGAAGFGVDSQGSAGFSSTVFGTHTVWSIANGGTPLTSITVTAPFSNGQLAFDLTFGAGVRTFNAIGTWDVDMAFLSTATLNVVTVRDSLGNLVANPGLTSESGFNYGQFTGVPEPSTWLTAAGAIAVALLRRRR